MSVSCVLACLLLRCAGVELGLLCCPCRVVVAVFTQAGCQRVPLGAVPLRLCVRRSFACAGRFHLILASSAAHDYIRLTGFGNAVGLLAEKGLPGPAAALAAPCCDAHFALCRI